MKIPFNKMKLILRPSVQMLQNVFMQHNHEIRIVGGAVRDLLMDKIPTDLDLATTATPNEMKKIFNTEKIRVINMNGEKHGTVIARIEEKNFAFSTLRIDKLFDNNHKEVEYILDWEQDAGRRDLTVNAMYLGFDGTIYDYFSGIQHLKERKVKFVGDPDQRIKEDHLRILRYFRFFGMLADDPHSHDSEAIESIKRNRDGLSKVSGERIIAELRRILTGKYNFELLLKMMDCGIGDHIGITRDFDQENLKKVYRNIKDENYHYCLLLAAGMTNQEEVDNFIKNVNCSNDEKEMLLFILKHRNSFNNNNNQTLKDLREALVDFVYKRRDKKSHKLALQLAKQLLLYTGRIDLLPEVKESFIPYFPIYDGLLVDKVEKKFIYAELRRLLHLWRKSDYTLTRDELLNKV